MRNSDWDTSEVMCDPGGVWKGEGGPQTLWRVDRGLRALLSGQQAWLCEQAPPVRTSCVCLWLVTLWLWVNLQLEILSPQN